MEKIKSRKTIGLMITYNEIHFIKYSLVNLLRVCDEIIILDNSNDGTYEYCSQFSNVYLYKEGDINTNLNYKERRQFVLDKGLEHNGTHFIVIDADEVMSNELIERLQYGFDDALYCRWYHINGGLYTALNNYVDEIQGIAFKYNGINYHGNSLIHEDKIPIGREEKFEIINEALLHFGTSDPIYTATKCSYYKCMELLEGGDIDEINMKYINELNVRVDLVGKFTYPSNVDVNIFKQDNDVDKYLEKIVDIIKKNPLQYYPLDIWRIPRLKGLCETNIKSFNSRMIVYNESYSNNHIKCIFLYKHGLNLLKSNNIKRIIGYILWRITGKDVKRRR